MVIKDLFTPEKKALPKIEVFQFAYPQDRLLASFLDFLLHIPVFTLLCSTVIYRLNLLKITVSSTSEKMLVMGQLFWVVFIGTVILQGIYLKIWHRTPGMRILKLELVSLNKEELTWSQCLSRSFAWCLSVCFFGLPLLEIFSHPRRLALHDRISETEIRSQKRWGTHSPVPAEKSMVHVVFTCCLMLFLGWMTAMFSTAQKSLETGAFAISDWREQSRLCESVDEVSTYSDVDLSDLNQRIDFSISLFYLDQIDSDCLRKEVDLGVAKNVSGPLVWVGRALLSTPFSQERQDYFARACAEDSRWCHKALYNEKATLTEAMQILKAKNESDLSDDKDHNLSISASKLILLNRMGAQEEALAQVEKLQKHGIRATGLVAEHLKAVSRSNPDRMPSVLEALKSVMMEKDFMRLNSDLCLRQLEAGCGGKVPECQTMLEILPKYKDSLNDLVVSRAVFKTSVCKNDLAENLEYWTLVGDADLQKLVRLASLLEKNGSQAQALVKIRDFVKNESTKLELRVDALQLLLKYSHYDGDWALISKLWSELDWTHSSFLAASEWLLREGRHAKNKDVIASMGNTFSQIPGLKLNWELLRATKSVRLPANQERSE